VSSPLVTSDDDDWASFTSLEPDWFLNAASRAVQKYCGWHISPNRSETIGNLRVGAQNLIMLPSRYVTAVSQLIVLTGEDADANTGCLVSKNNYEWHADGWIQRKGFAFWADWFQGGYYYGSDPYYLPVSEPGWAQCTFTHGYQDVPPDVKQVIFELAQSSMQMTSGNIKQVTAPNEFRLMPSQNFGLTLNPEQKNRLANYKLGWTS
jgi:hypothetical protein